MKLSPLLLGASLVLNVALVASFFVGGASDSAPAPTAATQARPAPSPAKDPKLEPTADTWTALKSDDIDQQIAHLREAGFPPSVVRSIITAQITASFAPRRQALTDATSQANLPPWKNVNSDPQIQAAQRALSQEVQAAIRAALGPDPETGIAASLRREHPYLPADKIDQLTAIRERYNNAQTEMLLGVSGSLTRTESDKLQALEKTMRDEIASVLSPQEWEEYNIRTGPATSILRSRLEVFDATEAEFRALHRIESAYYEVSQNLSGQISPERGEQLRQASAQRDEAVKAIFTPERLAEYQRASDGTYQQTTRLVSRLNLPPTTANDVYAVQKDIQSRVPAASRGVRTPEERNQALAPLAAEAENRISALLGPSGYEAYKQYGGTWMQTLAPRPAAPGGRSGAVGGAGGGGGGTTGVIQLR